MAEAPNEEEKGGSSPVPTPRSDAASRLAARRAAKAAAKAAKRGTAPVVPTAVTKKVEAARSFYEDNARLLLGGIGAGLLAAVAWIVISAQVDERAGEAAAQLYTGVEARNGMLLAAGEEPPEDALVESFPSAQARAEKARAEFEATTKKFADSAATRWATLGQANALRELGKNAEAIRLYERLAADEEAGAFVRARALEGHGFALEAEQKFDAAVKPFEKLAQLDGGAYKPLAEYHRARMLLAQGQKPKAAEVLEALIKAERSRPATEPKRYEWIVSNAETMLTELSVELNDPKLRADIPSSGSGSTQGLTPEILEALRKQLGEAQSKSAEPE